MFKICYNIENHWGIEIDELDERFQTEEEAEDFGNKEFINGEDWWIDEA